MWFNTITNEAQSNPPWWPSTYVSSTIKQQYLDAGWQEAPDDFTIPVSEPDQSSEEQTP